MSNQDNQVVIVDIKMPFMSMVVFMVKWVLASIPAFMILGFIAAAAAGLFGTLFS
jgi:hypothetical protein